MRQLDLQNGGLDRIEPEIAAHDMMKIARLHPVLTINAEAPGQLFVIGHDGAGVAGCAQILRGIKAEIAGCAHRSGLPRATFLRRVFGSDRLGRILDHGERISGRDFVDRIHFAAQTEEMHRHDRAHGVTGGIDPLALRITLAACEESASMAVGEMLNVTGSISTKIGVAPTRAMQPAVAKKV